MWPQHFFKPLFIYGNIEFTVFKSTSCHILVLKCTGRLDYIHYVCQQCSDIHLNSLSGKSNFFSKDPAGRILCSMADDSAISPKHKLCFLKLQKVMLSTVGIQSNKNGSECMIFRPVDCFVSLDICEEELMLPTQIEKILALLRDIFLLYSLCYTNKQLLNRWSNATQCHIDHHCVC